ncbi:MAG: PAS domain-containing protein [Rubrivivax sp.]|nr:PAS domain-containing protein [Rubrivivax sp.]MDP3615306.1 PAS domain-containing protein [Rubrivivax sp.]
MTELSLHAIEAKRLEDLRHRAASRLMGPAAGKGRNASAADALTVLHALASSPETAADALTLLHELQVHQVELDLQAQELRESRAELELALRRQMELYEHQPVGAFTIDTQLVLRELNQTGADMLGIDPQEALGLPLDAFFSADGTRRFRLAMASLDAMQQDANKQRVSLDLELRQTDGVGRPVHASIGADPAGGYLVSLALAGDEKPAPAHRP